LKLYATVSNTATRCPDSIMKLGAFQCYSRTKMNHIYRPQSFSCVLRCCPDLGYDDIELSIVRGLLLKLPAGYEPKDADLFVKFELAYPKETPQLGKTGCVRGTNSPGWVFETSKW